MNNIDTSIRHIMCIYDCPFFDIAVWGFDGAFFFGFDALGFDGADFAIATCGCCIFAFGVGGCGFAGFGAVASGLFPCGCDA